MAQKQDWNQHWRFWKDGQEGEARSVILPHDAMLAERRYPETNNGSRTGFFPGGKYFYEKKFVVGSDWHDKRIFVRFDGVYRHARIFLNGKLIQSHAYGYTPFEAELTGGIVSGANTLLVETDNSYTPNSRWYSGSGIYRPVWLLVREKTYLRDVRITTKSIHPAVVNISAQAVGESTESTDIQVEIFNGGQLVAKGGLGDHTIDNAKLWSAETPHLYHAVIRCDGDVVEEDFGIRTIQADCKHGLRINGVETKLWGACVHHDNGILGACAFADAEYRKAKLLKDAGYNAVRSAHNPCSSAFLEACDRLGLYVMDELYDGWYTPKNYHDLSRDFEANWRQDLQDTVGKDYNHPSVILYSIGNEVSEPTEERGRQTSVALAQAFRKLDGTRPVTCGLNIMLMRWSKYYVKNTPYEKKHLPDVKVKDESGSAYFNMLMNKLGSKLGVFCKTGTSDRILNAAAAPLDITGLNYGKARYDKEGKAGKRVIVGSETLFSDFWYNWPHIMQYKNIIGDFVWTGIDYLGETDIGNWRYPGQTGLPLLYGAAGIDLTGRVDAQCSYQQVICGVRKEPYIGVRPLHLRKPITNSWRMTDVVDSWTWEGHEGETAHIEVYARATKVRLYLNGQLLGEKPVRRNIAAFEAAYQPGKLEAVAVSSDGETRSELITAGRETKLSAQPDKTVLLANGQDLCYIPIQLTDKQGQPKLCRDTPVQIQISGSPVTLAGFGSAQAITDERFDNAIHTTYQGRALAILRAGVLPGEAKVRISAENFAPVEFTIQVI